MGWVVLCNPFLTPRSPWLCVRLHSGRPPRAQPVADPPATSRDLAPFPTLSPRTPGPAHSASLPPCVHRYPDAGPALHDGHHRGFLHQPHASADRHLQRQLGPHRQRKTVDGSLEPRPSDSGWREQGKVTPASSQEWVEWDLGGDECVGWGMRGSNDGVEQGAGLGGAGN